MGNAEAGATAPSRSGGGLQSLATSLNMLQCFQTHESLGVSELARRLGVAKSTAHRMLTTMCDGGFIERDEETGQYRLGMRLYELGQAAADRSRTRRLAMPLLEDLRQRTKCTVHLGVPDGAEILYVARLQSTLGARALATVGLRFPVHVTGSGKVIAAFDPLVAEARRTAGFPTWTPSSIRNSAAFDEALALVRQRGYAVNDQETVAGMTTVAAAVRDHSGRPLAAISLVGPAEAAACHLDAQTRLVQSAAQRLSRILGV